VKILADYWAAFGITNASNLKFLSWFQEANKSYLMNNGEQKKFYAYQKRLRFIVE